MGKKKVFIIAAVSLCACLVMAGIILLQPKENIENEAKHKGNLVQVKEWFASDIQELMDGKYENLVPIAFETSIDSVENIYNLEILADNGDMERTYLENLPRMEAAIEKFFGEDMDKSFLEAEVYLSNTETVTMKYDEIEDRFADGQLDHAMGDGWLWGSNPVDGKYVQITTELLHAWFSKKGLGTIHPSGVDTYKAVYPYLMGSQQGSDPEILLKDGKLALSELENTVLKFMNTDAFPLIKGEGIYYTIGEARIIEAENFEGVCFITRRIYKGIPFEYGSNHSTDSYIDKFHHDAGEITYVESTSPDTMLGFFRASGTVVEKEEITELITVGKALSLLSEQIGDNSVYEVHGVELIYRNCEVPEERLLEASDILEPKWKIITINQNDDKYTLFYVDVVTGEITNRFEYYYD